MSKLIVVPANNKQTNLKNFANEKHAKLPLQQSKRRKEGFIRQAPDPDPDPLSFVSRSAFSAIISEIVLSAFFSLNCVNVVKYFFSLTLRQDMLERLYLEIFSG
jgi:hypothetical protein